MAMVFELSDYFCIIAAPAIYFAILGILNHKRAEN